jgi:hypothetical protein
MSRRGRKRKDLKLQQYLLQGHNSDEGPIGTTREIIHGGWQKDGHSPVIVIPKVEQPTGWSTGESAMSNCAKDCSWMDAQKFPEVKMLLSKKVGDTVKYLLENVPVEWQLLLIGAPVVHQEKEALLITDYYIPKQVVGAAHVRNIDCIDKTLITEKNVVSTMHSHVDMSAVFSQTDWESCNSSPIKYHVVINKRYEYEAVKQISLACGMFKFQHIKIAFEATQLEKPIGFENITKEEYARGADWAGNSWEVTEKPSKMVRYFPTKEEQREFLI